MEYVSLEGLRLDGRRPKETRQMRCQMSVLPNADGSAMFEMGNTKVLAAVHGPRETPMRSQSLHDRMLVKCEFSMASFSTGERRRRTKGDRKSVEIGLVIKQALETAMITEVGGGGRRFTHVPPSPPLPLSDPYRTIQYPTHHPRAHMPHTHTHTYSTHTRAGPLHVAASASVDDGGPRTELLPRSQVDVNIQVLQADGGVRAAAINAAVLAIADAGIPLRDTMAACAAGFLDNTPLLDLNYLEVCHVITHVAVRIRGRRALVGFFFFFGFRYFFLVVFCFPSLPPDDGTRTPMTKHPFRINHPNIPMWMYTFNSLYEASSRGRRLCYCGSGEGAFVAVTRRRMNVIPRENFHRLRLANQTRALPYLSSTHVSLLIFVYSHVCMSTRAGGGRGTRGVRGASTESQQSGAATDGQQSHGGCVSTSARASHGRVQSHRGCHARGYVEANAQLGSHESHRGVVMRVM